MTSEVTRLSVVLQKVSGDEDEFDIHNYSFERDFEKGLADTEMVNIQGYC